MISTLQAATHDPVSKPMPRWALLVFLLFFVPYLTGGISWGYANGVFPIRPAFYMLALGVACLWSCRGQEIVFPKLSLLLLAFIGIRIFDIGVLQRFPHEEGNVAMAISIGSTLFLAFVAVVALGVWIRHGGRAIYLASLFTLLIGVAVNVAEFAGFGKFSSVPGRAAGFLIDANDSSIAIINSVAVCIVLSRRFWPKALLLGIAIIGVVPTFSRSGMIVYALVCVVFAMVHFRQHARQIITLAVVGVAFLVVGLGTFAVLVKDANAKARFSAIFGGDTSKMGSSERMKDLNDGLKAANEMPILGHGVGAGTSQWQPHNQFVSLWVDQGILAALFFVALWFLLLGKAFTVRKDALLAIVPHIAFIPFTQMQLESVNVLYSAIFVAAITSRHPIRFALWSPRREYQPLTTSSHVLG